MILKSFGIPGEGRAHGRAFGYYFVSDFGRGEELMASTLSWGAGLEKVADPKLPETLGGSVTSKEIAGRF